MKKKIVIFSALTLLVGAPSLAQNEASTSHLSPKKRQLSSISAPDSSFEVKAYQLVNHVDLRDVVKYDGQIAKQIPDSNDRLPGTSKKILSAVLDNTERFIGDPNIKYYKDGARGPSEKASSLSSAERQRRPFVIGKRYPHTYTNALFSLDYISAKEISSKIIQADLLLFAHSDQKGPFFKKITVVVDWNKNRTHDIEDVVQVTKSGFDIPISDTNFVLKGSIEDQKIILEDSKNEITKVFPVTVGAIDARDTVVESMNFHVPASNRRAARKKGLDPKLQEEFQDFSNAALINRRVWDTGSSWANTSERTKPYAFKGRPFIALVDLNYVDLNAEKIKYSSGYREIGLHYQITSSRLERGYRSHGCIRVRDKDLYQIDVIVNQGPKDMIKAVFKKGLPKYEGINHPHTYNKSVAMVKYTDKHAAAYRGKKKSESILCKLNPKESRRVRWNNVELKDYHTIIGTDCLTSTEKETGITSAQVKSYWNGTGPRIKPFIVNQEHGPIKKAKDALRGYGYQTDLINSMSHIQRLETLAGIKSGSIKVNRQEGLGTTTNRNNDDYNVQEVVTTRWPRLGLGRNLISANDSNRIGRRIQKKQRVSRSDRRRYYERVYVLYCVETAKPTKYEKHCRAFQNEALK